MMNRRAFLQGALAMVAGLFVSKAAIPEVQEESEPELAFVRLRGPAALRDISWGITDQEIRQKLELTEEQHLAKSHAEESDRRNASIVDSDQYVKPGRIYWIDEVNGDDNNDGSSPENAFLTLKAATDGIYEENCTIYVLPSDEGYQFQHEQKA
jgi:hypothetical protein